MLGFDAPQAAYAARVDTLTRVIGTFQWAASSLNLRPVVERREGAFGVLSPGGGGPTSV